MSAYRWTKAQLGLRNSSRGDHRTMLSARAGSWGNQAVAGMSRRRELSVKATGASRPAEAPLTPVITATPCPLSLDLARGRSIYFFLFSISGVVARSPGRSVDRWPAVAPPARRGARPRPAGKPAGPPAPRSMPLAVSRRSMPSRRPARGARRGGDRRLRWVPPLAGQSPRLRSADEPAGPAPRSTPRPRRGARCRPRAVPVVRCVKFAPDCRRDLRLIVATIEGTAALLRCGRCPPVSGRARRRPASLQWAITRRRATPFGGARNWRRLVLTE